MAAKPNKAQPDSLARCVESELQEYFLLLDKEEPIGLYPMVMGKVESVLLRIVMQRTEGNQTRAAACLGISRGTLCKKLKQHAID